MSIICVYFIWIYNFSDLTEYRDVVRDISIALDDDDESDSIISSSMSPSKSTDAPSTGNGYTMVNFGYLIKTSFVSLIFYNI